ncbi:nitroreductase family protein [Olsenella porci]|uniref:Nitroreductase domain-containing protein n=1 Tax=Olsenella porci TaxID=2652279 RepID=A0A6N7XLV5_9ACTN|nr:nitroreductase family protein [Olsenella porci]MST72218.1 hypothetical protein [Olsenella porci]
MNEAIRQLFERASARAFSNEPVSSEDERLILEAACQAPTAGNQRLKAFCERKWNSGFSREMTRSVAQMLSPLATGFSQPDEAGER